METMISLVFGAFSGWSAGEHKNTILGRMVAFSAFVTIAGLYAASITSDDVKQLKYYHALTAFTVSFMIPYYIFGYLTERKAKKSGKVQWKDGGQYLDVSDYLPVLSSVLQLTEESSKAAALTIASIKEQIQQVKDAHEQKSDAQELKARVEAAKKNA
jgi:hypothetical protein